MNNEFESLWEYSDPAASERRFRAALSGAQGDERLELLTQIARTYSLRKRFEEAHTQLDDVEKQLATAGMRPYLHYLLERGRTFNSSGDAEQARMLFLQAWEKGLIEKQTGLAVDAAHMLAITFSGRPESVEWNQRGLSMARNSQDPKAQALIPAMLNNSAWDLHDMGRHAEALALFQEAQAEWQRLGKPAQIQIAKWSVARCLRSLGRIDEALAVQRALEAEHAAVGTVDGYVFEEIAENLQALGNAQEAEAYFAKAKAAQGGQS